MEGDDGGVLLENDEIETWRRESQQIDQKLAALRQTEWKDEVCVLNIVCLTAVSEN